MMSSAMSVGRLAWLRQTSGLLRNRDRAALLGQTIIYGLVTAPAEIRRVFGIKRRRVAALDAAALNPPDSAAARLAEECVADMASPMVVNHSYRTYWWGAVLAAHDGLVFDKEVAYVASLMHDTYFEKPKAIEAPHCFTLPAVQAMERLGHDAGWEEDRIDLACEAISLHLNLIPPRVGPEAYAVFLGARLDVVGFRYEELGDAARTEVLTRYPRLELKRETTPRFESQARSNPGARMHFYTRFLAANWFMRHALFDS
jgi:hypothetical protein